MKSTQKSASGKKNWGMRGKSQSVSELFQHFRATALTFASVTNGVALALGVSQTLKGDGAQYFYVLNFCSFVLLVRLWWRYVSLISYYAPSSSIDQYCVDFAIAAVGIAAVFFFNQPDRWAFCYAVVYLLLTVKGAQLAATLDPIAYGRLKDYHAARKQIRHKIFSHLLRAAIFGVICLVSYVTQNNKTWVLSSTGGLLVIFFIFISKNPYDHFVLKRRVPFNLTAAFQDMTQTEPRRAKKRGRVKKGIKKVFDGEEEET